MPGPDSIATIASSTTRSAATIRVRTSSVWMIRPFFEHLLGVVVDHHDEVAGARPGLLEQVEVALVEGVEVAADDARPARAVRTCAAV